MNDHLCYVVTQIQSPWHLPMSNAFHILTKFVITHSAKSKCKLAIFNDVVWKGEDEGKRKKLSISQHLVQKQALWDYEADAVDLSSVALDQVSKLGARSKTNKAAQIFGAIGQSTQTTQVAAPDLPQTAVTRIRKMVRPRSLRELYVDALFAEMFRLFTIIIDVGIAVVKTMTGLATAHTFLVVLLATSTAYNAWYGYRDGLGWYHERNAGKFMAQLGVRSDPTVSRAIYLSDIEGLVAGPTIDVLQNGGSNGSESRVTQDHGQEWNTCRGTFRDIILSSGLEMEIESGALAPSRGTARRAVSRLQRTRQSLARYRHDLLVAMRVVNRVEEEVVQAEWEEWVREEENKCKRVQAMMGEGQKRRGDGDDVAGEEGLGEEFNRYCESCRGESMGGTKQAW